MVANEEDIVMKWLRQGLSLTLLMDVASPVHSHDLYVRELIAA
jgi:hypothetical protein